MARPRLSPPKIYNVKLYLRAGQDDDLIAFMESVPDKLRAKAVMQAMRSGKLAVAMDNLPSDDEVESSLAALVGLN